MEKLLIFPFNGNGLEAIDCIKDQYDLVGFIDDTPEKQGMTQYGFEVFGRDILLKYKEAKLLAVPGSPTSYLQRSEIINNLGINPNRFATVIHPKTTISSFAKIGFNVLIMAGVVLTSNCIIGNHVCILPNTVVHHDSAIGNYTLIGSNTLIAGNVMVGEKCYIGSGSNIINNVKIGRESLIGIGSNVVRSIAASSRVAGNPAKEINL
jgi:sugar O-acyltransferase (sialic acid O-acetyltransferase NeuD family)